MSMINVQSTRSQKSNEGPQGREKYALKDSDSNTATPIYAASMIVALALYLKSVLVTSANASPPPPDNNDADSADQSLDPDVVGIAEPDTKRESEENPEEESKFDYFSGHDLADVQYVAPQRQAFMTTGVPVSFSVSPLNDNRAGVSVMNTHDAGNRPASLSNGNAVDGSDIDNSDDEDPTPSNRRPVVARPVVLYDQFACIAVMIALNDLLRGASDPDGDRLQIRNATVSSGELVLVENGFRYHGEQTGPVTITYQISDGQFVVMQTATFNLLARLPLVGTSGDDNLLGTECEDIIFGNAGGDQIDGRDDDDTIDGGDGNDHIVGGNGDDVIFGQDGNDIIFGGPGNDTLSGGQGDDQLFGGEGNDVLLGGSGDDQISDGAGRDHVDGEAGDDAFIAAADSENDLFSGDIGTDSLDYSASVTNITFDLASSTVTGSDIGADQIAGIEVLVGGQANDTFFAVDDVEINVASPPLQSFNGGEGIDTLNYSGSTRAVSIDTVNSKASGESIGTDAFDEIERIVGSDEHDRFIIGEGVQTLEGRDGNDVFEILTSVNIASEESAIASIPQSFNGGDGIDTLDYSEAGSAICIDVVNATSTGEPIGTDTFAEIEHFIGSGNDDRFIVGNSSVTLEGGGGNDMFECLVSATTVGNSPPLHYIIGFDQGDWVRMSKYDIFEDASDILEDAFNEVYGNDSENSLSGNIEDDVIPIRIRHEVSDTIARTYIDADFDNDSIYELSVQLDGELNLMIINNQLT